jgi:hypothetical protein
MNESDAGLSTITHGVQLRQLHKAGIALAALSHTVLGGPRLVFHRQLGCNAYVIDALPKAVFQSILDREIMSNLIQTVIRKSSALEP